MGNNTACRKNRDYRTAETLYTVKTRFVSGYIIVNNNNKLTMIEYTL